MMDTINQVLQSVIRICLEIISWPFKFLNDAPVGVKAVLYMIPVTISILLLVWLIKNKDSWRNVKW